MTMIEASRDLGFEINDFNDNDDGEHDEDGKEIRIGGLVIEGGGGEEGRDEE